MAVPNEIIARETFCRKIIPAAYQEYEMNNERVVEGILDVKLLDKWVAEYFKQNKTTKKAPSIETYADIASHSFIIGEAHFHISPKRFLIEHFKLLKEAGFKIFFIEHFFYDVHQQDLDDYCKTGKLSKQLMAQLRNVDRHGYPHDFSKYYKLWQSYNFRVILEAAREAGLRIVGLELSLVYKAQKVGFNGQQENNKRTGYFNYTAIKIIERETQKLDKNDKWCALVGNTHVKYFNGVEGIADVLAVPAVLIMDTEGWQTEEENSRKTDIMFNEELSIADSKLKGDIIVTDNPKCAALSLFPNKIKFDQLIEKLKNAFSKKTSHWLIYFEENWDANLIKNASKKQIAMSKLAKIVKTHNALGAVVNYEEAKTQIVQAVEQLILDSEAQQDHPLPFIGSVKFKQSNVAKELKVFISEISEKDQDNALKMK